MSEITELHSKITSLQKDINLKRARGMQYSNELPSLNKLKKERDDLIEGAETQQLRDEVFYLTNKFKTLKDAKHESNKKLTEINNTIIYLSRNYPYIFN